MGKRLRLFFIGIPIAAALILLFILQMLMRLPEERIFVADGTAPTESAGDRISVRVGVVSRYSPSMIYQGYQPVMDFLSARTDYHFELRLYPTYRETVERLVSGEIDAAFLGSLVYVETRDRFPVVPILRPLNDKGEPTQQAVIITRADGGEFTCSDLSDRRVAVPSDQSFAATWFERIYLPACADALRTPPTIEHFSYHPTVVFQVLRGAVDFGVVKDRIAADYAESGIRIVGRSPVIPSSPLVVRRNADPIFVAQLSEALIEVTRSGNGRADVSAWDIEFAYGFQRTNERDYDELAALSARMVRR
jgi:phosphonate transport system substrate-binding protein